MIEHNFKAAYYHYKDQDTLIEQSSVTSNPIRANTVDKIL